MRHVVPKRLALVTQCRGAAYQENRDLGEVLPTRLRVLDSCIIVADMQGR